MVFHCGVLDSKYVFISNDVIDETGAQKGHIIQYIKEAIENSEISYKYKPVREFKMTEDVIFTAYERVEPVDEKEVNYYKEKFKELSNLYPDLYENRLNQYEIDKGIMVNSAQ